MNAAECKILRLFRHYQVGPAEMLFLSSSDCRVAVSSFLSAMRRMIDRGWVVKERPDHAYSLTREGYRASLSLPAVKKSPPARQKTAKRSRVEKVSA